MNLLDHFRGHLVAKGIVRLPSDEAGKIAGLHPLWLAPSTGLNAPGEGGKPVEVDNAVVLGARRAQPVAGMAYASWTDYEHVQLMFRVKNDRDFDPIERAVRAEFVDRRNWVTTTGLRVVESGEFVRAQPLGSDKKSFTYISEYWFQIYSGLAPREQA